jgi:hypothetical protein
MSDLNINTSAAQIKQGQDTTDKTDETKEV